MNNRYVFLYIIVGVLLGITVTIGGGALYLKKFQLPSVLDSDLKNFNIATTSPKKFTNIPVPKSLASESYYNSFNKTLAEGTTLALILNNTIAPLSSDLRMRWEKKDFSNIVDLIISIKLALTDADASGRRLLEDSSELANLNISVSDKIFYDWTVLMVNTAKTFASDTIDFVDLYNMSLKGDQTTATAILELKVKADKLALSGKEFFTASSKLTSYFIEKGNLRLK